MKIKYSLSSVKAVVIVPELPAVALVELWTIKLSSYNVIVIVQLINALLSIDIV